MLNIARNIYSGWDGTTKDYELPEAEVIPIGESANERRKIDKVVKKYATIKEFENIPLPGFTLYRTDRKRWGSTDQTWLVIDPRGFLVRITSDNLEKILHVTGITEGLIQEKCVWAREDSQTKMILVPVSSDTYIKAVTNTDLIENKVNIKDVQIGDTVLLQNGLSGKYMGVASLYGPACEARWGQGYRPQTHIRRQIVEVAPHRYHYQTDVKILKVVNKTTTPITIDESVAHMLKDIESKKAIFSVSTHFHQYYFSHGAIKFISAYAVPKVKMTIEEIDIHEASLLHDSSRVISDTGCILLENLDGSKFLVEHPSSFVSPGRMLPTDFFAVNQVADFESPTEVMQLASKRSYTQVATYSLDNFAKFYKIVKHVKNETYV